MQNELLNKWLLQQKELFGDSLYISQLNVDFEQKKFDSLEQFKNEIKDCKKCPLGETRRNFVFGVGNSNADLVLIGEAPEKKEDIQGEPFVGRSGKLLDRILEAINLDRTKVYIINILKCHPPNNRNPNQFEIETCEPYLKTQLQMICPKLIVTLGEVPANTLLRSKLPLSKLRNIKHNYNGIDLIATYHPTALRRNPYLKKAAWDDFKNIRDNYLIGKY